MRIQKKMSRLRINRERLFELSLTKGWTAVRDRTAARLSYEAPYRRPRLALLLLEGRDKLAARF